MSKSDPAKAADISGYAMGKLYRDEPVSREVIMNICKIFHCGIGDVVEFIKEDQWGVTDDQ